MFYFALTGQQPNGKWAEMIVTSKNTRTVAMELTGVEYSDFDEGMAAILEQNKGLAQLYKGTA